jgi:heptosyltransferase-2
MAELFAGTEWFDEYWLWEPGGKAPVYSQWRLIGQIRRRRVDLMILFPNSLRTALIGFLGGASQRIGYARDGRGALLTGRVFPPRRGGKIEPRPMVETYLRLAEAAGCPPESPHLELVCTEAERRLSENILAALGFDATQRTVGLVYAGAQGPARRWPSTYCAQLARRIVDSTSWQVLVIAGPDERSTATTICQEADHPRVQTMVDWPNLGLSVAKACLAACSIVISPDSGPRHIAAAFGKPLITLYGPTDPIWGYNPTVRSVNLSVDLPCLGCLRPSCPYGHHACMWELRPEMVFSAFCRLAGQLDAARTGPGEKPSGQFLEPESTDPDPRVNHEAAPPRGKVGLWVG